MKLTTITNVSVDGVMQGLGGPDEDRLRRRSCSGPARAVASSGNDGSVSLRPVPPYAVAGHVELAFA
jgi:hypothetical protein